MFGPPRRPSGGAAAGGGGGGGGASRLFLVFFFLTLVIVVSLSPRRRYDVRLPPERGNGSRGLLGAPSFEATAVYYAAERDALVLSALKVGPAGPTPLDDDGGGFFGFVFCPPGKEKADCRDVPVFVASQDVESNVRAQTVVLNRTYARRRARKEFPSFFAGPFRPRWSLSGGWMLDDRPERRTGAGMKRNAAEPPPFMQPSLYVARAPGARTTTTCKLFGPGTLPGGRTRYIAPDEEYRREGQKRRYHDGWDWKDLVYSRLRRGQLAAADNKSMTVYPRKTRPRFKQRLFCEMLTEGGGGDDDHDHDHDRYRPPPLHLYFFGGGKEEDKKSPTDELAERLRRSSWRYDDDGDDDGGR